MTNQKKFQVVRKNWFECLNCGIIQPKDNFKKDRRTLNGYSQTCNDCRKKYRYGYKYTLIGKKNILSEKECTKCKKVKSIEEFGWRAKSIRLYNSWCKECINKRSKEYYYNRTIDQKEQIRQYQRKYKKTKKGREAIKRGSQRNYQKNKYKFQARSAVHYAILKGRLSHVTSLKCSNCEEQAEHYHHHKGYKRKYRLDVIPVCESCHRKLHTTL